MVNHLKQFHKLICSNRLLKIQGCNSIIFNQRNFSTEFKDVYSKANLLRCLNDLNGLSYSKATDEQKIEFFNIRKNKEARKAAVLVPFCYNERSQPSILFTVRSPQLSTHKFEVCFPGGVESKKDKGFLCETAARESKEELGVTDESIDIIGILNAIPGKSTNSFVFPVLALVDLTKGDYHNIEFHNKNCDEVEQVILRPLSELIKEEHWSFTHWQTSINKKKNALTTPMYRDEIFNDKSGPFNAPRIWGLTAYILYLCLTRLVPDHFKLPYNTLDRYTI